MTPSFDKTVDILVKAYLNDTLKHGDCYACAVGNLVAHSCGYRVTPRLEWFDQDGKSKFAEWKFVFMTVRRRDETTQSIYPEHYNGRSKEQIDSTGYTWQQLAKLEYAFETCEIGETRDEFIFNGLMAVVDVLAEIHQVDLSTAQAAKELFVR